MSVSKALKYVPLIIACIACLCTSNLGAQTELNGPVGQELPDDFEKEFESFGIDENPPLTFDDTPAKALGENQNGQMEYSVLENPPTVLSIEQQESDAVDSQNMAGSQELNDLITRLVLKHMPHEYVKDKNWGKQTKRWAGVKFRRDDDDGKLETKRRYKMVNHGTWRKYSAKLADPEKKFAVEVGDIGTTKERKTKFEVSFLADLLLDARQSKWVKGVQLYSFSAEGTATVRLTVNCELGIDMDFSQFPPDIVLAPSITKAKIDVAEFDVQRVSKAGGEFAQQISRLARKELDGKIDEHEKKLLKKLNEEIDENRDKMRLSIADAVKLKWFEKARDFIPENVRDAVTPVKSASAKTEKNTSR